MIQLQIKNTKGYGVANGVKILVYGRAGRGKTTLCATCPNPIVLSAEGGLLALNQYSIPYIEIRNIGDLRDAYTWARSSTEAKQFQTICLDSISEVAEVLIASLKQGKKDHRQAYGDLIDDMSKEIRNLRDLVGKHIYMSCKQERVTDANGITLNGPSMPGKRLGEAMPYFPDEVFQLDIDPVGGWRFLRTQPDYANDAKDRSGVLAAVEEPNLGKIIDKINNAVGRS